MASVPTPERVEKQPSAGVREFAARHYMDCGAAQFGMDQGALDRVLAQIAAQNCPAGDDAAEQRLLASLRVEELVLARACAYGDPRAWQEFLKRYRTTLYESAYKIARTDSEARELADSLYAELYGVDSKGEQRTSKLLYYQGRGSLQGWLRVVIAQEFVNRYRSGRRETSLDAAVEDGAQFAAPEPERAIYDARVEAAVTQELRALDAHERFLLAAYYLDHRTLAEIGKLQGVHESTISRQLEKLTTRIRNRIRRRLVEAGMPAREVDEVMEDVDVRDLKVKVRKTLEQGSPDGAFYPEKGETEG